MSEEKYLRSQDYDAQWLQLDDFIRYNPGARHRRRLIIKLMKGLNASSVLDVGCGPGEIMLAIKKSFPDINIIHGADFAKELISKNNALYPNFSFYELDIENSSLDRQYDLVICSEVIEHIKSQEKVFSNLVAMVKPGGHLLVTCPTGQIYETQKYFGHVKHPSKNDLLSYAKGNSLEVVDIRNWGWPFYKLMSEVININPQYIIKEFTGEKYGFVKRVINNSIFYFQFLNKQDAEGGIQLFALFKRC